MAEIKSEPKYLARKLKGISSRPKQRWYDNVIADFLVTRDMLKWIGFMCLKMRVKGD
jgi:hypothetical protein